MTSYSRAQPYGPVAIQDPSLTDSDFEEKLLPGRPLQAATPSRFAAALQQQQDQSPPPINWATCILIRSFPIVATFSWLATLLTLLFIWIFHDHLARYKWYLGLVPYLGDCGAVHPTIFLVGNIITAVAFVMSLWAERLLRAQRVMVEATEERLLWVAVGTLDVLVAVLGGVALVLLAVFDAFNFPKQHNLAMTSFIVCVTLSGLLNTAEVEHLWHEHPDRHDLRDGTVLKWIFLSISAASGICFWVLYALCDGDATKDPYPRCYRITSASAILEWVACFGCAAYLSTLALDVWPASRHRAVHPRFFANATGLVGVWHGSTPVSIPPGIQVRRLPVVAPDAGEGGGNGGAVVVAGYWHGGGQTEAKAGADGGNGSDGIDSWYEEGKRERSEVRRSKSGRKSGRR
ncbi:hypothetical protein JCM1840_000599 [Sporobolomyces johnsonii]